MSQKNNAVTMATPQIFFSQPSILYPRHITESKKYGFALFYRGEGFTFFILLAAALYVLLLSARILLQIMQHITYPATRLPIYMSCGSSCNTLPTQLLNCSLSGCWVRGFSKCCISCCESTMRLSVLFWVFNNAVTVSLSCLAAGRWVGLFLVVTAREDADMGVRVRCSWESDNNSREADTST